MTEQEKLDYYELHKRRPPEVYIIYRLCYESGRVIERKEQGFETKNDANDYCVRLAEESKDTGRIILLFVDRTSTTDEAVKEDFKEFIQMFWPVAVKDTVQTFFEVL